MDWLNYHHLYYFWLAANEGSIAQAAEFLKLSPPTISKQLHQLEQSLGGKLFTRAGRGLLLTDFGQMVLRHAEEIFSAGRDLEEAIRGRVENRPLPFIVGMPDVLPKLICHRLLRPAFEIGVPLHLICHEGRHDELLTDLAAHRLDLVLSDSPSSPTLSFRTFNHTLTECGLTFFAHCDLAEKYVNGFPRSLDNAPMLLPTSRTSLRRDLEQWFYTEGLCPQIVAEFQDSGLMKVFGQDGMGIFPAPTMIEAEVSRQYDVCIVGRIDDVRARYFAISVERKLRHPAVVAVSKIA